MSGRSSGGEPVGLSGGQAGGGEPETPRFGREAKRSLELQEVHLVRRSGGKTPRSDFAFLQDFHLILFFVQSSRLGGGSPGSKTTDPGVPDQDPARRAMPAGPSLVETCARTCHFATIWALVAPCCFVVRRGRGSRTSGLPCSSPCSTPRTRKCSSLSRFPASCRTVGGVGWGITMVVSERSPWECRSTFQNRAQTGAEIATIWSIAADIWPTPIEFGPKSTQGAQLHGRSWAKVGPNSAKSGPRQVGSESAKLGGDAGQILAG